MASEPPPSGVQQNGFVLSTIFGPICTPHVLWWLAPYIATSVAGTYNVFLVVGGTENDVASETQDQSHYSIWRGEVLGIPSQVLALDCVNVRKRSHRAPAEIEAKVIVTNVEGFEVPGFVHEQIDHIDGVQEYDDKH